MLEPPKVLDSLGGLLFFDHTEYICIYSLSSYSISQLPYKLQPCFIFLLSAASQIHGLYIHTYTFHAQFLYFER